MPGAQPPSWSLPIITGDPEDAPLPPPHSVLAAIPPFHLHGEHKCGDHKYDTDNSNFERCLARQAKDASTVCNVACSNCHVRVSLNRMHDLPCGHLICRNCLLVTVFNIKRSMERNRDQIRDARGRIMEIDRCCASNPGMDPCEKKRLLRRYCQLRRSILRLIGLLCCGLNMKLDRFLPCLAPAVSRGLWLVMRWAQDQAKSQRACAWPDCGAYLPICCKYSVVPFDTWRYYCVSCRGNSKDCARTLQEAQTAFPFLPQGLPALTPAR